MGRIGLIAGIVVMIRLLTAASTAETHLDFRGHGSPEGVLKAGVGEDYTDLDNGDKWVKTSASLSGLTEFGWNKIGARAVYGTVGFMSQSDVTYTNLAYPQMAVGTNDLWTCPAGKRAFIAGSIVGMAGTNTTLTATLYAKINGDYYRIPGGNANFNTNTSPTSVGVPTVPYCLEAGEGFSLTPDKPGYGLWITFAMYPTNIPLRTIRTLSLSAGNNVIYTVPAGKAATAPNVASYGTSTSMTMQVLNHSGGARSYSLYFVPSGASAGVSTLITTGVSTPDHSGFFIQLPRMTAGDSVVVASDAATALQWAYVTAWELDL